MQYVGNQAWLFFLTL